MLTIPGLVQYCDKLYLRVNQITNLTQTNSLLKTLICFTSLLSVAIFPNLLPTSYILVVVNHKILCPRYHL